MDESVSHILEIEILTASSKIALIIPIPLHVTIDSCNKGIASDIEFSVLIEKRLFYVLLNDIRSFLAIDIRI
jgi:hypothetical protein